MRVLLGALVVSSAMFVAPTADAACAGPTVTVTPDEARPGDTVRVKGGSFADRCNDTRACYTDGTCEPVTPAKPRKGISVDLVLDYDKDSPRWHLATVDANEDFQIDVRATIPADVPPGKATIIWPTNNITILPAGTPEPTPTPTATPEPTPSETPAPTLAPTAEPTPTPPAAQTSSAVPAVAVLGAATTLSAGALFLKRLF